MIFNTTGGANPLNFYVKTYPSETELKADKPRENTIGVITTTTMTSWVFSATEPKEPEVGMVWISVGQSSKAEFNALKKNILQVYPIIGKQFISNTWTNVTALSFQEDEWISWIRHLYNKGDECTGVTGGWVNVTQTGSPAFTQPDGKLRVAATTTSVGGWRTKNKIDFTNAKTIEFNLTEAKLEGTDGWIFLGILSIDTISNLESNIIAGNRYIRSTIPQLGVISVDTANIKGEYYVYVALYTYDGDAAVSVDEIECL